MPILESAIGAVVGGLFAALSAYIGVRTTLTGQEKTENVRRRDELAVIRLARHTEVSMIGFQLLVEYRDWLGILKLDKCQKNSRTAFLPPLTIYEAMAENIGRLSRDEIVALIGFAGTVSDIGIVGRDLAARDAQSVDDQSRLVLLLSSACGKAAECLSALPMPDAGKDKRFIGALQEAFQERESERRRKTPSSGGSD